MLTRVIDGAPSSTDTADRAHVRTQVALVFEDVNGGMRGAEYLIDSVDTEHCEVELIVLAEPLTAGISAMHRTHDETRNSVTAAAMRWLREVGERLSRAGIHYRGSIQIGPRNAMLRDILQSRPDSQVIVAARAFRVRERLLGRAYRRHLEKLAGRPVTVLT